MNNADLARAIFEEVSRELDVEVHDAGEILPAPVPADAEERASRLADLLVQERGEHRRTVAAIVEAAGGQVTVPRRLLVDPPGLMVFRDVLEDVETIRTVRVPPGQRR